MHAIVPGLLVAMVCALGARCESGQSGGPTRIQPATCVEWFELHNRGFTPRTSLDEQDDGLVMARCEVLRLIGKARPSRQIS